MGQPEGRGQPKWRQVAGDLRAAIVSGEYPPGARLPTKEELKASYGVALATVNRALDELRGEGLIETAQGSGTYAREPAPAPSSDPGEILARMAELERRMRRAEERLDGLEPPQAATTPEPVPVVAAVVTSGHAVLVTRRRDGVPPWGFPAGEIEPGESPAEAGVREVEEETTLRVAAGPEIARRVHPQTARTMVYMAAHPAGRTDVAVGDERELIEVRWVGLDEALALLPTMHAPVRAYLTRALRPR